MNILMKIFKIIIILIEVLTSVICASELIDFFENPAPYYNHYFESEAMMENGGWKFRNVYTYVFDNSIMILSAIGISIFSLKVKQLKYFLLLLFIVICQIVYFFLL